MATISKFEDLEIWQLARIQAKEFFDTYSNGNYSKDFELKNQFIIRISNEQYCGRF